MPFCKVGTINFIDTLFTSTSATTTTGFSINDISTKYTVFGQIIIAILMNIGAVGFISLIVVIFKIKNRRISLSNMKVINDSIADNFNGVITPPQNTKYMRLKLNRGTVEFADLDNHVILRKSHK